MCSSTLDLASRSKKTKLQTINRTIGNQIFMILLNITSEFRTSTDFCSCGYEPLFRNGLESWRTNSSYIPIAVYQTKLTDALFRKWLAIFDHLPLHYTYIPLTSCSVRRFMNVSTEKARQSLLQWFSKNTRNWPGHSLPTSEYRHLQRWNIIHSFVLLPVDNKCQFDTSEIVSSFQLVTETLSQFCELYNKPRVIFAIPPALGHFL